jgi:hypothetical protein
MILSSSPEKVMVARASFFIAVFLSIALLFVEPSKAQVQPSAAGGPGADDDSAMSTPPPVSGMPYASGPSSEGRSNLITTSVAESSGYTDNVLPNATSEPVGAASFSIIPSIALDRSTTRHQEQLSYTPSFTFYTPTSVLDTVDQSASLAFQFRANPHASLTLMDSFVRTSNVYNQSYAFSSEITASTQSPTMTVVAPFAAQMNNSTSGILSYQIARNAMIGGGGSFSSFTFLNPSTTPGLNNSTGVGGNVFYSRRSSRSQYWGLAYNYDRILSGASSDQTETQISSALPFYTIDVSRTFTVSVSAGVSYVALTGASFARTNSWSPSVTASAGWQGQRGTFAAKFSHAVTAGGGLLGAYGLTAFGASGGWRMGRRWNADLSASYSKTAGIVTSNTSLTFNGDTIAGQVTVGRSIGERFNINFGYQRLHQNYGEIQLIAANPDSDREFATITYSFKKALGR